MKTPGPGVMPAQNGQAGNHDQNPRARNKRQRHDEAGRQKSYPADNLQVFTKHEQIRNFNRTVPSRRKPVHAGPVRLAHELPASDTRQFGWTVTATIVAPRWLDAFILA